MPPIISQPSKLQRADGMTLQKVTIYTVVRTLEPHYHNETEIYVQGHYLKLKNANRAVEKDLLSDWDEEFFDEYEKIDKKDGTVGISATGGEGDHFEVFIEKKDTWLKIGNKGDSEKNKQDEKRRKVDKPHVYAVMQVLRKDGEPALHSVHANLASANKAVGLVSEELLNTVPGTRTLIRGLEGLPDSVRVVDLEQKSWDLVFVKETELMAGSSSGDAENNGESDGDGFELDDESQDEDEDEEAEAEMEE